MVLPTDIYEVIDPPSGIIAKPAWLGEGWAKKFKQPCVFYLGGAVRLMAGFASIHAVRKSQQVTFQDKYRDYVDVGLIRKEGVAPHEVKSFFNDAFDSIPESWKTHRDFAALNWGDRDLSVGQITKVLNNQPTSLVKCFHVLAVINALITLEAKDAGADPRLGTFKISDPHHGLRVMPAIYVLDGFNAEYYGKHFAADSERLTSLANTIGNPGTLFFEHVVKNRLPVTHKTVETVRNFCIAQGLPQPGFVRATAKIERALNGQQPRFKSASGEKPDFP